MWLLCCELMKIEQNLMFSTSIAVATFKVLSSHTWLIAIAMNSTDVEISHHFLYQYESSISMPLKQ